MMQYSPDQNYVIDNTNAVDDSLIQKKAYHILASTQWLILRKGKNTLLVTSDIGEVEINRGFIALISFHSRHFDSSFHHLKDSDQQAWLNNLYLDDTIKMSFLPPAF